MGFLRFGARCGSRLFTVDRDVAAVRAGTLGEPPALPDDGAPRLEERMRW